MSHRTFNWLLLATYMVAFLIVLADLFYFRPG